MPLSAWRAVVMRSVKETSDDNVGLVAAGVAFYGFLALIPMLGALVLSYGLIAEPSVVLKDVQGLMKVMPADAAKILGEQLMSIVETSDGKKGLGLLLAIALAIFGARNGAGSIITALNIAYEEKERRGIIWVNLLALLITVFAIVVALIAALAIALLGRVETLFPGLPDLILTAGRILAYALLVLAGAAGAATLYRYAPSRRKAKWVWITPGSILAAGLWLGLTLGFGLYVANFGNYNATYGSLGAVVVLLTWLYLSSYVLIFGAELNSEFERQTAADTTEGPDRPLGKRGAAMADQVVGDEGSRSAKNAGPRDQPSPSALSEPSPLRIASLLGLALLVALVTTEFPHRRA